MTIKTNQFKDSKPKKEKKTAPESNPGEQFKRLTGFISSTRFTLSVGIIFLFIAIFLLLAFTSYYLTWTTDDNKVSGDFWSVVFSNNSGNAADPVKNWMGAIGVFAAAFFIKEWFGLAAFLIPVFLIYLVFRLMFRIRILPFYLSLIYFILGTTWISIFFGFFFNQYEFGLLSGKFGYIANQQLDILIGKPGTGMLLLAVLLLFLIVHIRIPANWFKRKSRPEPDKNDNETDYQPVWNEKQPDDSTIKTATGVNGLYGEQDMESLLDDVNPAYEDDQVPAENILKKGDYLQKSHTKQDEKEIELTITGLHEKSGGNKGTLPKPSETEHLPELPDTGLHSDFDPRLELSDYRFPDLDLLDDYGNDSISIQPEEIEMNKRRIVQTLNNYDIEIQKIKATVGPTVTLYEIVPAPGVRINKIRNLEYDIALSLAALGIRIIAPIPGKGTIGIEVPNLKPEVVSMKSILGSEKFQSSKAGLPFGIGKTIANESFVADLTKMPHILMAGATGQGKSVGLNAIIASLLYKKHPAEIKFVMVDPKKVELTLFTKIERHFLAKLPDSEEAIITDTRKVVRTLNSLCIEMENRYELLKDAQVRNIGEYNVKFIARKLNPVMGHRFLPFLVLVIDEFADLIMTAGKEIEIPLTRLAQLARAVGIHLIIATQRPSVNIITGSIKANFPARIAFRVISKIDSRTILDQGGADQLVGRGDMLFSTGNDLIRLQCAFIDTHEVEKLTEYIGSQRAFPDAYHLPEYFEEQDEPITEFNPDERDSLFEEAASIIVATQQGSTSLLQRKLKIGYNRAGRIIDQLEAAGIVGPFEGSKARDVKIANEIALEQFLKDVNDRNNQKP